MACNENIIKNIANEVTRNCQAEKIIVESEFVAYLIQLLLLNPKYGKLFTKTLNRNNLAYFVDECKKKIAQGGTPLNTLKIQYIMYTSYDKLDTLIEWHLETVDICLEPLLNEILDAEPEMAPEEEREAWLKKIYRKIGIYIIMYSGLGSPGQFMNLKEGMGAMGSVFPMEELKDFLALSRSDRSTRLGMIIEITSGVRLFNRDCDKGGTMLPELPQDLFDAGNACLSSLSNSLMTVMQRVNTLTTAVGDRMMIDDDTGNVYIDVPPNLYLTEDHYHQVCRLLIFNRQYEIYIRRLLSDVQIMVATSKKLVDDYKKALDELHGAVKYKTAVPCDTVFPLFMKLWHVWRSMQNTMYLVSTVNCLVGILKAIQDSIKIPTNTVDTMMTGKIIITDEERMNYALVTHEEGDLKARMSHDKRLSAQDSSQGFSASILKEKVVSAPEFLGFCVMCLNVGALVPSNLKLGVIKHKSKRYGFCSIRMAAKFLKDPDRYINAALQFARNEVQIINLLNMEPAVREVKDIEPLIELQLAKKKLDEKDIQTDVHPIEMNIDRHYSWNLWEWKKRACQWANIVKCQTHSTQTNYSHMRSEIHCQTVEPRDKCQQTMKEIGINTNTCNYFFWGLRGQIGDGQHLMDMVLHHKPENAIPKPIYRCAWPCERSLSHVSLRTTSSTESLEEGIKSKSRVNWVYDPNAKVSSQVKLHPYKQD